MKTLLSVLCSIKELDEFWAYKALLQDLTKKLSYCVKAELIPLMEVAGVLEVSKKKFCSKDNPIFSSANCYGNM